MTRYDVAVVGCEVDALVAATRLAQAGHTVALVGRPDGAASAPRVIPGPFGEARWTPLDHGVLHPRVVAELGLAAPREERSAAAVAVHHRQSGWSLLDLQEHASLVEDLAQLRRDLGTLLDGPVAHEDLVRFVARPRLLAETSLSVEHLLRRHGIDGAAGEALAQLAVQGQQLSPRDPGSGLLLALRLASPDGRAGHDPGEDDGPRATLLRAAAAAGVTRLEHQADRIRVEAGAATAVSAGGDEVEAAVVVSGYDARRTLLGLVGAAKLPLTTVRRLRAARHRGSDARLALVLHGAVDVASGARRWLLVENDGADRTCDDLRLRRFPSRPVLDVRARTLPGAAPRGATLLTATVRGAGFALDGGWTAEARTRLEEAARRRLGDAVPDLEERYVASELLVAPDLERLFGATEGHLGGGEMGLDQLFSQRAAPGCEGAATPIAGLFLGGPAVHPGDAFPGLPGLLCAEEVLTSRRGEAS